VSTGHPDKAKRRQKKEKEAISYANLAVEDKDFSAVDLYGSGHVSPRCVGFYGTGRYGANRGDADGRGDAFIYGTLLVGSVGDGCAFRDPEGFGESLDKYDSGHSFYGSQHLSLN